MNETLKLPFYAKLAFSLVSIIAIFSILYYGQAVLIPVMMATLFAILLGPLNNFFKSKMRMPHVIAVSLTVTVFVLVFVGIIFFLSWQISDMMSDWGKIKSNVNIHLNNLQSLVKENFNLSEVEQKQMIDKAANGSGTEIVGTTILSVTDTLLNLVLLPIYTFLILLYKTHFIKFLGKLFKAQHHAKVQEILGQIRVSVQSYIAGLIIETVIVSVLTTIGFMIIGVPYAFLLGVITGILNLIPYIGILIAGVISMVASLTGSPEISIIIGVIVVNILVQFIDNNFLVPMIVSSKVEINALVSIVGIIIGSSLGGIAGMFLAIPIIAIMKVIFDRIDELKAWGYLMGDDLPKTFTWNRVRLPFYHTESGTTIFTTPEVPTPIIYTDTTTNEVDNPKSE